MSEQRYTLHLYSAGRQARKIRFKSPIFKNYKSALKWLDSQGVEPLGDKCWVIRRTDAVWGPVYEWMIGCKFRLVPINR